MASPRILVVEDERIVALHLCQQLAGLGYEVTEAVASGDQALRLVEASPPDLVLMDINLEGHLDGIATAALLPAHRRIPVIYLTAYSEDATLARASETKPYGYLLKPFSDRELHAMIQVTLARCRAERAADAVEASRRHTEKMAALGELAGGVADDFDELLNVIYGQLDALGQAATTHRALADPIGQAFEAAIEKEKLIRQLLAFSGRQKLTPRTMSVNEMVSDNIKRLQDVLGPSIRLRAWLPDDLWDAWIDPGQLGKALLNIAANARDAMPDGGDLTIEARNADFDQLRADAGMPPIAGRYIGLSISDTGAGMSGHVLEHAYEPFFTTKPAGDGLGLSLVFGFIRQSGGHISIDSTEAAGTTVRLWLPAVAAGLDDAPASRAEPAATQNDDRAATLGALPPNPARRDRSGSGATNAGASELVVAWQKSDTTLFATVPSGAGEIRFRLIVEPLPIRNGWDWTVWRPDRAGLPPRHGRATSVVTAMAAAEAAVRCWAGTDAAAD